MTEMLGQSDLNALGFENNEYAHNDSQIPKNMLDKLYETMDTFLIRKESAKLIWRNWISFKEKRIFYAIKESLRRAEFLLTKALIKRLNTQEAEIISDPTSNARIRFRLSGISFPPVIVFKIFTQTNSVQYFSGHKIILTGSKADFQSFREMGTRKYLEKIIFEKFVNEKHPEIHDLYDATNAKEYIRYLNSLDERPQELGGRGNTWRELNLDLMNSSYWSTKVKRNNLISFIDEEIMQIANKHDQNRVEYPMTFNKAVTNKNKRRKRIEKMKKIYGLGGTEDDTDKLIKASCLPMRDSSNADMGLLKISLKKICTNGLALFHLNNISMNGMIWGL
ncbi:hypothetical protein O9G_004236 [Rozella allomycis CSF55]|uniref:Uncharacterized protein n=1 Tax=Rozella allomycis (strain CSF55) TaxID=988480 RepID=A0A075B107_ROZAC|nr:hypothetical protein O9G_004236 [Rozella allomycis CSF55]|eukprot:EPZ36254.1 hypothetical protein O9G_004236 [Rozella allomycis CSF55]